MSLGRPSLLGPPVTFSFRPNMAFPLPLIPRVQNGLTSSTFPLTLLLLWSTLQCRTSINVLHWCCCSRTGEVGATIYTRGTILFGIRLAEPGSSSQGTFSTSTTLTLTCFHFVSGQSTFIASAQCITTTALLTICILVSAARLYTFHLVG